MKLLIFAFFIIMSAFSYAQPKPAASAASSSKSGSGSRDWVIDGKSFISLLLTNSVKHDNGAASDESGQAFDVEFGRNFGKMEFGPRLGYSNGSPTATAARSTILGAYFRYNLYPNRGGINLVPYAKAYLLVSNEDAAGVSTDRTIIALSTGATWFPLNDVFGISGYLAYQDSKVTGAKINGFLLATGLAFYF